MIRLLTHGVRIGLVAAAMAVSVPMITLAQTTEPASERSPAEDTGAVDNTRSAPGVASSDNGPPAQSDPPAGPNIPAAVQVEIQSQFNELRRELLDDRAGTIDWWLVFMTVVLGFFAIVAVGGGYIGFSRFREIETDAKTSVTTVTEIAEAAKRHLKEIERNLDRSAEIVRRMNAQTAADDPEEAKRVVTNVRENPRASLLDKVIADAVSLQQQGKRAEAANKWRAIANIAEGRDNDLAANAWFSIGHLVGEKNPEDALVANNQALRLKPDLAEAYYNRGVAKRRLGRYDEAIDDWSQALRLEPDLAEAYVNRGIAKKQLGRYDDALVDYDKAIRLKPNDVEAHFNRGTAKAALDLKDEARKDFETALELAQNANNANLVAQAEQLLRDLDPAEGS